MERLTNRIFVPKGEREVVVFTQGEYIDTIPAEMTHEDIRKVLRKLCEYEDLEEQGLLLRLPTEAYFIKDNKIYKGWVQEVVYSVCCKLLLDIRYDDKTLDSYRGYVGNTVFLTQAEAEQKLKEMESIHFRKE